MRNSAMYMILTFDIALQLLVMGTVNVSYFIRI